MPVTGKYYNHAVLMVGWGVSTNNTEYWIIKNSWSTNWGIEGYAHVEFGARGVGRYLYYPLLQSEYSSFDLFKNVIVYGKSS